MDDPPIEAWEIQLDDEETAVRKWREKQLREAGFSEFNAFRLSMVNDWHRAAGLLAKGASEQFVIDELID